MDSNDDGGNSVPITEKSPQQIRKEQEMDLMRRMQNVGAVEASGVAQFMTAFDAVRQFHASADGRGISFIGRTNKHPPLEVLQNRYNVLKEEFSEEGGISHLRDLANGTKAMTLENLAILADWIADMEYFLKGLAVNCGIPHDTVFMLVHMANMRKTMRLGGPIFREDGKIMKPEGWVAPDVKIHEIMLEQHKQDTAVFGAETEVNATQAAQKQTPPLH